MKILGFGIAGIIVYVILVFCSVLMAANNVTDILLASLGGCFVATLMSVSVITGGRDATRALVDFFLAVGASVLAWIIAILGLTITTVWLNGTAAMVFDITVGVAGAFTMYAFRLQNRGQEGGDNQSQPAVARKEEVS